MKYSKYIQSLVLIAILLYSFLLRLPTIQKDSPYLYNIDDAPAFDWVLRIIKNETLDPGQYIKPALPVYSYLPAIGIGFLKAIEKGEIRKFGEIATENKFGDGGHEYTVSHPTILKYAKKWAVFISILLILAVYYLGKSICGVNAGLISAFFLSLSNAHLIFSHLMWFTSDMMVGIFCCFSTICSINFYRSKKIKWILLSALFVGLTISSKYNSVVVMLVPILSWTFATLKCIQLGDSKLPTYPIGILLVVLVTGIGFIGTSPYSLINYREFLDGAGWQVWAYKRAWVDQEITFYEQFIHYMKWIAPYGLGWGIFLCSLIGLIWRLLSQKQRVDTILLVTYPIALICLMCTQKINYIQNMIPVLPFMAVLSALFVINLSNKINAFCDDKEYKFYKPAYGLLLLPLVVGSFSFIELKNAYQLHEHHKEFVESRDQVENWIFYKTGSQELIGIAGELQFSHKLRNTKRVKEFNSSKVKSIKDLLPYFQSGYSYLVFPGLFKLERVAFDKIFKGVPFKQRILENPEIKLLNLVSKLDLFLPYLRENTRDSITVDLREKNMSFPLKELINLGHYESSKFQLNGQKHKGYIWLKDRYSAINFKNTLEKKENIKIELIARTLWKGQTLKIFLDNEEVGQISKMSPNWKKYSLKIPLSNFDSNSENHLLELIINKTGSPKTFGINGDKRRLGIAINSIKFLK